VRFEPILNLLEQRMTDSALQAAMQAAKVDSASPVRPSVEVTFHAMLLHGCEVPYIGHTHPLAVNAIDPKKIALGYVHLYESTDGGNTVTDLTKEIDGVRTVVGWIEDLNNGEVNEKEIAFYAQDKSGNVWYFGEHPEDYQNGSFVEAPTWIAGFQNAKPGIEMLANPQVGMQDVYQGWGPAVDWSDYAHIDQMGLETCVPVSCYKDVLVNAEANLTEKGAFQLKFFAPGVGEVRVGWKGDDNTKEELQLVEYKQLSPAELADIHAKALALEKHAYEVSPDAYGQTPPMQ